MMFVISPMKQNRVSLAVVLDCAIEFVSFGPAKIHFVGVLGVRHKPLKMQNAQIECGLNTNPISWFLT